MNAYPLLVVLVILLVAALLYFTPKGRAIWKWALHGPVKSMRNYKLGVALQYSDGYIEYVTSDGVCINIYNELYNTPRDWSVCATRYGENGTVTNLKNHTYYEMVEEINHKGDRVLTYVDIITGVVHVRLPQ